MKSTKAKWDGSILIKEESLLTIVDMMGRSIIKTNLDSEGFSQLNIEALMPGVYLVIVVNGAGRWVEKLVIEH